MANIKKETDVCGVKYIGDRPQHIDNLYGTNLTWTPGQVHNVSTAAAEQLLKHADVYAAAEKVKDEPPTKGHGDSPEVERPYVQVVLPNFDHMTKQEMQNFAQEHFGEKIHHATSEDNMRNKIMSLIGERGLK